MKAFDLAASVPWAITQEALQTILEIAARENPSPEAVAAQLGRPLDNTHEVTVRNGIATIPVEGPVFRHANLFTQISGATSIETLATDLRAALDDPTVRGIVLSVDSPGGEVNGTSEFADMVYAARNTKPITAYIADMGASAAYWIASAADEVVVADTAKVGSIGVVAAMRDPAATTAKTIEFVSSQSPNKRPDIATEKGRAQVQGMVDALADVFVGAVARNRGVTPEAVLAGFGAGGIFVGQGAVDAGLADRVGSYEGVLADMATKATSQAGHTRFMAGELDGRETRATSGAAAPREQELTMADQETTTQATGAEQAPAAAATQLTELEARLAHMEAELSAAKAREEAAAVLAREAADREAQLRAEARRKAFADEAATGGWHGAADEHVGLMEALVGAFGAESAHLETYRRHNRAVAEQLRQSKLFEAMGTTGSTDAADNPTAQFEARVQAVMASEKIDYTAAALRIASAEPQLYQDHIARSRGERR